MKQPIKLVVLIFVLSQCNNNSKKEVVQAAAPPKAAYFSMDNIVLAAVQDKASGLWGYIDRNGNYVISPKFQGAKNFKFNRAPAKADNSWGLINGKGEFVVSPTNDEFEYYKDGVYKSHGQISGFAYIDTTGKLIESYGSRDYEVSFINGIITTYNDGTKTYEKRDLKGNRLNDSVAISEPKKDTVYGDGLRSFEESSNDGAEFGFADSNGRVIIKPAYETVRAFSEGRAVIGQVGWGIEGDLDDRRTRYCYIDRKGHQMGAKFDKAGDFHFGLAPVRERGRHTQNNTTGEIGYQDGNYGYIDTNGFYAIEPKFLDAAIFQCGGFNCQNVGLTTSKADRDSLNSIGKNAGSKPIDHSSDSFKPLLIGTYKDLKSKEKFIDVELDNSKLLVIRVGSLRNNEKEYYARRTAVEINFKVESSGYKLKVRSGFFDDDSASFNIDGKTKDIICQYMGNDYRKVKTPVK